MANEVTILNSLAQESQNRASWCCGFRVAKISYDLYAAIYGHKWVFSILIYN